VIENRERHGAGADAVEPLLVQAHELANLLADRFVHEEFPRPERILYELAWPSYDGPCLVCDIKAARSRLTQLNSEIVGRRQEVRRHLDLARHILYDAAGKIRACLHEYFEFFIGDQLWRMRETPGTLKRAQEWILLAEAYCAGIDAKDSSPDNVNRAVRAWAIASLAASQTEACVAKAMVKVLSQAKGYPNFEVLGHQALAFAELVRDIQWQYCAAPLFAKPECELSSESRNGVGLLANQAAAALSYATTLKMTLRCGVRPAWQLQPIEMKLIRVSEPLEVDRDNASVLDEFGCRACAWMIEDDGETARPVPIVPAQVPALYVDGDLSQLTQAEIAERHRSFIGTLRQEAHSLTIVEFPKQRQLKRRLVGFEDTRGRGCRKKREGKA
jgi:hypothetical protein